ncbi:hypothetical protein [Candidatus Liberibacter africanus]|uniref:hypothetical protein n=1 Tax=Liberibacter africanus TaxID=34020 RepID=UPI001FD52C27|nr:hypothetical protein [Candidatus Liberibacter africanus]
MSQQDAFQEGNVDIISLDLMGSDLGAGELILGASKFLEINPKVRFLMYGDSKVCLPILDSYRELKIVVHFIIVMYQLLWMRGQQMHCAGVEMYLVCGAP